MIMDQEKAFFAQCFPEFKGSRALRDNKYLVEKNYKTYTVNTAIQEAVTMISSGTSSLSATSSTNVLTYPRYTL
jgi:hypothetical protein